jgi:hypothetical protein
MNSFVNTVHREEGLDRTFIFSSPRKIWPTEIESIDRSGRPGTGVSDGRLRLCNSRTETVQTSVSLQMQVRRSGPCDLNTPPSRRDHFKMIETKALRESRCEWCSCLTCVSACGMSDLRSFCLILLSDQRRFARSGSQEPHCVPFNRIFHVTVHRWRVSVSS